MDIKTSALLILLTLFHYFGFCQSFSGSATDANLELTPEATYRNGSISLILARKSLEAKDYKMSFQQVNVALKIFGELENDTCLGRCYQLLGDIYSSLNEYENSIDNYFKAIEKFELVEQHLQVHRTNHKIGSIELRLGNVEPAKEYLRRAQNYFQLTKSGTELENVYYTLGILYGNENKLDSSLLYFTWCTQIMDSLNIGDAIKKAGIYNNLGALHSKLNQNRDALKSYNKALSIFESEENQEGIGVTYSNIAFLHQKNQNYTEALRFYDSTLHYLNEKNAAWYMESIYNNISDLYLSINDHKKAFEYFKMFISIKDSLESFEVKEKIFQLETRHEISKKNEELLVLEKENKSRRNTQLLLILCVLLILIVAVLVIRLMFINLKNTRLKHQMLVHERDNLSSELHYKTKEVEDFALRIIEKNRFLEELNSEIKQIKGKDENADKIKNLTSNIRHNLYIDQDRRKFEEHLDDIHHSFMYRLSEKIPNLTKSEKRLCSLIVIGLSTKDMSTILNISIQGVKTARHRLRKKLNLSQNEDLADFLSKL